MTASSAAPRILVVRVGAMGDVLHAMPSVAALRAALPGARIDWAIEPRWAPLLAATHPDTTHAHLPLVSCVQLVEAKAWTKRPLSLQTMRSIRALRHALRQQRYDLAIDLQGTLRSAVIARMSGAPRIVGSASPRERPARLLYTERVTVTAPHVIDQAVEILAAATNLPLRAAPVPLPFDVAADAWCANVLNDSAQRTVFLAPTAGWGAKEWPAERYGQFARELHALGCRVLVNASPHGVDRAADVVVHASGNTAEQVACTLPQLIALLRRISLVVAGDTGPLHLAAALGVPVVALFGPTDPARNGPTDPARNGPTDPARNGPYGTRAIVLRHASSRTDHHRQPNTEAGLQAITTAEVLAAAQRMLAGARRATDQPRAY